LNNWQSGCKKRGIDMPDFLTALLRCSVSMSLVTLTYVAILPLISKRYAAKWRYLVWLAIAAGWIFPFRPRIDLSFLAVPMPELPLTPVQPMINALPPMAGAGDIANAPTTIPLWSVLAAIWILGVLSIVVYHALRHRRFRKMVRRWRNPVTDLKVLAILNSLKSELEMKTQVGLDVCQSITSPMLVGFFRPAILLPPAKISDDELSLILKHELIHLGRHDLWSKALILAATALHWFNPVVYLMARAAAIQCEISCDALVLQGADLQRRRQYGETIIGVVRNGAKLQTSLSTNYYGGKRGMKTRIYSIMDTTKKKAGVVVLCAALIAIIGTGTVFAVAAASPKEMTAANTGADAVNPPAEKLNMKETFNMDNYSEFLQVKNDAVKYYYHGHWVFSLYDENNEDAKLINEKAKSIIYENAMEDKDVKDKGTPVYLKTVRNKETNKIEKLVEMPADEAWKIINSSDDKIIRMARTPSENSAASDTKNTAITPSTTTTPKRVPGKETEVPAEPVTKEALPEYWAMGALNVKGLPYLPLVKTAENLGYTVKLSSFQIADKVPDWNPQYPDAVEYNYELSKGGKSVGIASLDVADGIVISAMLDQIFCHTHDKSVGNSFVLQNDTVYMPAQFFKEALDPENKLP
jgi:bla regulator protein BlaR1